MNLRVPFCHSATFCDREPSRPFFRSQNDISVQPLAIRRFLSRDPFNCTSAIHHDKLDNESCWHDGIVLGGTDPDELDDSTHPRSATAGANQSWDKWPVEFGSGQVWKVAQTFPTTCECSNGRLGLTVAALTVDRCCEQTFCSQKCTGCGR